MDDRELRNKMEFVVEQQAKFAVDIQLLREAQAAQQTQLQAQQTQQSQLTESVSQLKDVVTRLANASLQRFERLEDGHVTLVERMTELAERQTRTAENLHTLAVMFERFITRENGGAK